MLLLDCRMLLIFFIFRLLCVYFVKTSFVPDEYWQSLEVSHKLTFGYGHLTWEWSKKIRSCVYPFVIHLLYKIIPDYTSLVIFSPKLLQSALSSIGDFFAFKFATEYFGKNCGLWTAFNILTSWFLFYCSSRTLTNMVEASLTACGLYFYPWPRRNKYRLSSKYIWLAGVSVIIRPTAIVTWFPLYVWHILRERNVFMVVKNTFIIGCAILTAMLLIDRWCYESWVFTPYNFFVFNWSNDIGAFYGSHNFLWYFFVGLPVVLGLHFVPFICGLMLPQLKQFYLLILWVLLIFSLLSHKEFRFLLPILHLCMIINGFVMNELWSGRLNLCKIKISSTIIKLFSFVLVIVNIWIGLYMGLFHQRGVIDATLHLSETVTNDSSVLFLMPCHSTPYYSYIHKNIKMKFLSCEPNFENDENYVEEADSFFADPHNWLLVNYESDKGLYLPSHIVMFDSVYNNISNFLKDHSYRKCFSAFHSHFAEGRAGRFVYTYCR